MRTTHRRCTAWSPLIVYLCGAGIGVLSLIRTHPSDWDWDQTYVVLRVLFVFACLIAAVTQTAKNIHQKPATGGSSRADQTSP